MNNLKRKNIVKIRTNSDMSMEEVKQLLKNNNNLGAAVRNSNYAEIYWFQSSNNYERAQKDFQIEFVNEHNQCSVYVGFNSDWQGSMTADHIFVNVVAPHCPFATACEVKNYIRGWVKEEDQKIRKIAQGVR